MKIDGRDIIKTSLNSNKFMGFVDYCNGFGEPIAAFNIEAYPGRHARLVVSDKALILIRNRGDFTSFRFEQLTGEKYDSYEDQYNDHRERISNWLIRQLRLGDDIQKYKDFLEDVRFRYVLDADLTVNLFNFNQFVQIIAASLTTDPFMIGGDKND